MLDVWRDVLMMWMGSCQNRIMGMWVVVVPVYLLAVSVDLVAIARDQPGIEVEFFQYTQPDALWEEDLTFCKKTSPSAMPV